MFKYLINLLATATSLVTLLLIATSATALPQKVEFPKALVDSQLQRVSLNVISPELKTATESYTSFSHFGCTCAVCTQAIKPQFNL
ncbi:hypothetical protein [Myxosarcina sp. GI1]|uniref:hypothetical protein n=1 Tax=Myxosarcina sp. GI1 TaxID=1541065 RepID=UPI000565B5D6|nr:hypothetical protein [Myxosarcina sp. GI1]